MSNGNRNNIKTINYPLVIGKQAEEEKSKKSKIKPKKAKENIQEVGSTEVCSRNFSHYKILTESSVYSIKEVSVYSKEYIWGVEIKYMVNGKPIISLCLGTAEPEYIETIKLADGEDVNYIAWSYSNHGVHTMTI